MDTEQEQKTPAELKEIRLAARRRRKPKA